MKKFLSPKAGATLHLAKLPGAITQGDILDEARENLRDAIELVLEADRSITSNPKPGQKMIREKN